MSITIKKLVRLVVVHAPFCVFAAAAAPYPCHPMKTLPPAKLEAIERLPTGEDGVATDNRFTALPAGATESNHAVAVVYDASGWMLIVSALAAPLPSGAERVPGGTVDLFLRTDAENNATNGCPFHLTYRMNPDPPRPRMVPFPMEERAGTSTRSRYVPPRLVEETMTPLDRDCWKRLASVAKTDFFMRPSGGWVAAFFFPWEAFHGRPLLSATGPVTWRLRVVRTLPNGTQTTWGAPAMRAGGAGLLEWRRASKDLLAAMLRQSLGSRRFTEVYDSAWDIRFSWQGSSRDRYFFYGRLPDGSIGFWPEPETFEMGNRASDDLFMAACLTPWLDDLSKLGAVLLPDDKTKQVLVWNLAEARRAAILAQADRIRFMAYDLAILRRDYLLNRLLGRSVRRPQVDSQNAGQTAPSLDSPTLGTANWNVPEIRLEDDTP